MSKGRDMTPAFFVGAGTISLIGWASGTALGSVASSLLPLSVRATLGVLLYGMFIAIVVPQARQEKPLLVCTGLALVISCLFTWMPGLKEISEGIAIVLCTIGAAAICAVLFPLEEEVAS